MGWEAKGLLRQFLQQGASRIPQLLAQVNVVAVRVLEALDLVPQCADLRLAELLDVVQIGRLVDALAVLAAAYRKAEDRIGGLIAANDAKAAAPKDNAIDLSQILGEVLVAWGAAGAPVKQPDRPADDVDPFS